MGLVAASTFFYINDESQQLVVERIPIPIKNLPPGLEGFRIAQITDIHLYPLTKPALVSQAVEITNGLKPDLIVLTGDYVWHEAEVIHELTPILARLNARHGVYAIMGNHDIWTDEALIMAAFAEARLPMLVNQGLTISEGGASFYLAGLDDGWSGAPDLDAALTGMPSGAPVILLYHEPDLARDTSLDPRISLQLSGHTHGGQIRLPLIGAPVLPYLGWKYDQGLYKVNDMWLYTNRGIGMTNIPFRYNCPPEISEFTLMRA